MFLRCRRNDQRLLAAKSSVNRSKSRHPKAGSRPGTRRSKDGFALHSTVRLSQADEQSNWKIKEISNIHRPLAWVKRNSDRLLCKGSLRGIYAQFAIPYLDRVGKDTGEQLYTHVTTFPSFFASIISTKISRLRALIDSRKIEKWKRRGLKQLCCRVAILSTISRSDYIVDRFCSLMCTRGVFKIVNAMIRRFVAKLSDDKWFVYRHTSSQVQWLDLRWGVKPPKRDKLKIRESVEGLAAKWHRSTSDYYMMMYDSAYRSIFG